MGNSELQKRHLAALKDKYQVRLHRSISSESFLYLILRKAELGLQVLDSEFKWLAENRLFASIEIISLQQYQAQDLKRLQADISSLRNKYSIPEGLDLPISDPVYSMLWKLDAGDLLTDAEIKTIASRGFEATANLIQDILNFSELKIKYKANKHSGILPEEPLYSTLKKLDTRQELSKFDTNWLSKHSFEETLEIHRHREDERKATAEFLDLKARYHVDSFADISSPLYPILKKLKEKQELEGGECNWLEQHKLTSLIEIDRNHKDLKLFEELKVKYCASQHKNPSSSSRLFQILKNIDSKITENEILWLMNEGLTETAEVAKRTHFKILKSKYRILGQLALNPFYEIMLRIERQERLDPKQVLQLIEEGHLYKHGKIAIAHYRLEAIFCEKEYQRTKNLWDLATASSNWRKAGEPQNALRVTEKINWNKAQEPSLESALRVTRGAAFRDLDQLDEAEQFALQAKKCQPRSHQPYTLLGAICYSKGEYQKGDEWFQLAASHGATDANDEIKRIVRMIKDKDKRREAAKYLLEKDPDRFSWAKSYLK